MSRFLVVCVLGMVSAAVASGQDTAESEPSPDEARELIAEVDQVMYSLPAVGARKIEARVSLGEMVSEQIAPGREVELTWQWKAGSPPEVEFRGIPEETGRFGEQFETVILLMLAHTGLQSFESRLATHEVEVRREGEETRLELLPKDESSPVYREAYSLDAENKLVSMAATVEELEEPVDLPRGRRVDEAPTRVEERPFQLQEVGDGRYLITHFGPIRILYRRMEIPESDDRPKGYYWVPTKATSDSVELFEIQVTVDGIRGS